MSVNLEVKGTLAKLLATEDLVIEHKNVSTASFNVQSRVLTLPRWDRATNNIMNLLVSHEVGHALFTPNEDFRKKTDVPMGFINVTEDVRIEALMKRKFGGLPKTFFRGYHELHDQDFFGIEDEDVSLMNIADRVNLHFKIGNFVKVPFTDEELVVVKQCADAVTFDDAIAAAEALYALHELQKEEQQQEKAETGQQDENDQDPGNQGEEPEEDKQNVETEGEGETQSGESNETESEESDEGDSEEIDEDMNGGGDTAGDLSDNVSTMENFDEKLEELNNRSHTNPTYIEYPSIDLKKVVASNKEIHDYINETVSTHKARLSELEGDFVELYYGQYATRFKEFMSSIKSEVNYMVKEFECKKSAAAYARATTSRTGVLDCTKVHTYKYNEDLFKKVTSLPEGKNHGLVFVLDWSGSMYEILEDTMKQLLSLALFCDKVNIPFDVYAFTHEWNRPGYDSKELTEDDLNKFHISADFNMMNILTSKVNRKEMLRQMESLFMIASSYSTGRHDIVPHRMSLSGTPLNEAILCLREILPQFKQTNGVEKAHVMILTDGEASLSRTVRVSTYDKPTYYVGRFTPVNGYIRNRKTGTVLSIDGNRETRGGLTSTLLEDLGNEFPESTFTGFRILEPRGGWFVRQACGYDEKIMARWKKEKSIALTNFGYDKYYVVSSNAIQESAEFSVDEGATKAKIKNAFAKSLKGKKNNKKILGDFIGLIA